MFLATCPTGKKTLSSYNGLRALEPQYGTGGVTIREHGLQPLKGAISCMIVCRAYLTDENTVNGSLKSSK